MQESIQIGIVLILVVQAFLLAASSIRFHNWSDSEESDIIFGIPFWFILFGTIGSFLTVGLGGLNSIAGIPVLLFLAWRGKLKISKPRIIPNWHLAGLLLSIIFFLVKFLVLYDPITDNFFCSFHDDYSYLQQINLLESQQIESHFSELIRSAFFMDVKYKAYHLIEFYFVLLSKALFGGSSFSWFNFFLKPFLNLCAVLSCLAFFQNRYPKQTKFWPCLILVLLFYSTLRFNLIDEFLSQLFTSSYWKAIFFQNYYFAAPLSYFVSYKIALAFIFLVPLFSVWTKGKSQFIDLCAITAMGTLISIAYLPFFAVISGLSLLDSFIPQKTTRKLFIILLLALSIGQFFLIGNGGVGGLLKFSFSLFFSDFNLVFENYYWQLFYFSALLIAFTRKSHRIKSLALLLLLFPLVYLSPGILFKVYSMLVIGATVYLLVKNPAFTQNPFFHTFLPTLAFLYFLMPLLPGIPNLGQVFSNYLFPLVILSLLEYLFHSSLNLKPSAILGMAGLIIFVNWPAIAYDNRTPLHSEIISDEFFRENCFKEKWVNIISITSYTIIPAIDQHQLGQGILNRADNAIISMAEFEEISDAANLEIFRKMGFLSWLKRIPAYEETIIKRKSLNQFLAERKVKVVLLENSPQFENYLKSLLPITAKQYSEEISGYRILVLK